MATVLITGGTGLVGSALTRLLLEKDHKIIILSRRPKQSYRNIQYAHWDIDKSEIDKQALQSADYIFHLAGAGIFDKRWTAEYKNELVDSRVRSAKFLLGSLLQSDHRAKAVISASATGIYGPDTDRRPFSENQSGAAGFLPDLVRQWEGAVNTAQQSAIRTCNARFGIVLSRRGGLIKEMDGMARLGVVPVFGDGTQTLSWAHIGDVCRSLVFLMETESCLGPYNVAAPNPVSYRALAEGIVQIKPKRKALRVPEFMIKTVMGERAALLLESQNVSPKKLLDAGFRFLHPDIYSALAALYG